MFSELIRESFWVVFLCSGVPLLAASGAGLIVAVLQTATQIQEQSLSYVVKFGAISAVLGLLGGWFGSLLLELFGLMFRSIAQLGRLG